MIKFALKLFMCKRLTFLTHLLLDLRFPLIQYDCSQIEHVCTLYFVGLLDCDIVTSTPPLECLHCLFVCNLQFKQIAFLYIQTLHNDCSHIVDVHQRCRSRAVFGLVFLFFNFCYFWLFIYTHKFATHS